jgi:hypothetical protein
LIDPNETHTQREREGFQLYMLSRKKAVKGRAMMDDGPEWSRGGAGGDEEEEDDVDGIEVAGVGNP